MSQDSPPNTFVYFIQAGKNGPIKIGFAQDPQSRMHDLQTSHHEELILIGVIPSASRHEENELHRALHNSHIRGEWYNPSEEVMSVIEHSAITQLPATQPMELYPGERIDIQKLIADCNDNISIAATALNCSRRTLQLRMRRLCLDRGKAGRPPQPPRKTRAKINAARAATIKRRAVDRRKTISLASVQRRRVAAVVTTEINIELVLAKRQQALKNAIELERIARMADTESILKNNLHKASLMKAIETANGNLVQAASSVGVSTQTMHEFTRRYKLRDFAHYLRQMENGTGTGRPPRLTLEKLIKAIKDCNGNLSNVAKSMQISGPTIHSWLNRFPEIRSLATLLRQRDGSSGNGRPRRPWQWRP